MTSTSNGALWKFKRSAPHSPSSVITLGDQFERSDTQFYPMIHHLMALGHRRIAFAVPDGATWEVWHSSLRRRHQAYLTTLEEMNLEPVPGHDRADCPPTEFVRYTAVEHGATAIVAYHLPLAVKLLRAATMLDLRVPHHLSLVCFNDLAPAADLIPSLTAMSLPSEEMGRHVAELLM